MRKEKGLAAVGACARGRKSSGKGIVKHDQGEDSKIPCREPAYCIGEKKKDKR